MKIKLLDTFAGVGGFHLALEQSVGKENVECIWFSEIDKFAKQVYQQHFPESPDLWDITKIDIQNLPDFDLLTGWFPCQDVSVAWKQSLEWWRTVLVEYLLQILEKKQPKYFVFENVKGLMSKKFDTFRESIFERIENAWYWFDYEVLNTKDFWLPQNRERIFIVWIRNDVAYNTCFLFPKWQELSIFLKDILEEEVDEKYYLSERFKDMLYKHRDRHDWKWTWFWFKPKELKNWEYASTLRANAALCPTDNILHIKNATKKWYLEAEEWDGVILDNPNSRTKRGRVKKWISWTLTCVWSDWFVVKWPTLRRLTPTECARLQGFPDKWSTEFVSNSQAYKQMWNAISVPVVKVIFDNLF